MLRKLSIILALAAGLAVPSAAMARGGGFHGGGFGGFHGGGFGGFHGGGFGGFRGGGFGRGYGGWGGYYGGDWGGWPFYGYDDSYYYPNYYSQPVYYYHVRYRHYGSRCHNVNHSIWHHGLRYWRTVRVCYR